MREFELNINSLNKLELKLLFHGVTIEVTVLRMGKGGLEWAKEAECGTLAEDNLSTESHMLLKTMFRYSALDVE